MKKLSIFRPLRNEIRRNATWIKPIGTDTGIRVHNPITKSKDSLICNRNKFLTCYSCGPTVYDESHIGHASSYVRLDIIRRILRHWFSVRTIVALGVTDIDDKILARAASLGVNYEEVAQRYEIDFFTEMDKLNVLQPHFILRVTDHIPEIIAYITEIIRRGHAYVLEGGNVYFNTQSLSNYGKVTRAPVMDPSLARSEGRLHPADFVLWKAAKEGEPSWKSPWGEGRPGWHIECSAMASKIFGKQVDIHTGGLDLAFPHHENEEAQSCAFHSVPQWVNYWLHTGHLLMNGFKMSKSMKNFIPISKLLETHSSDQFRMLCLMTHYRTSIDYNPEVMVKAVAILNKFSTFLSDARNYQKGAWERGCVLPADLYDNLERTKLEVKSSLADDFNTTACIDHIEKLVRVASKMLHDEPTGTAREPVAVAFVADYVESCLHGFGLLSTSNAGAQNEILEHVIDTAVSFRNRVRQSAMTMEKKNKTTLLECCDSLRKDFRAVGVTIKDSSKNNSTWNRT